MKIALEVDRDNEVDKTLLEACIELERKWRKQALAAVPDAYAQRNLAYKYLNADNAAAGRLDCADELADLIEKKREQV